MSIGSLETFCLKLKDQIQVAQIATAADYEQKRLMATKAMHHKVIKILEQFYLGPRAAQFYLDWFQFCFVLMLNFSLPERREHPLLPGLVLDSPAPCQRLLSGSFSVMFSTDY